MGELALLGDERREWGWRRWLRSRDRRHSAGTARQDEFSFAGRGGFGAGCAGCLAFATSARALITLHRSSLSLWRFYRRQGGDDGRFRLWRRGGWGGQGRIFTLQDGAPRRRLAQNLREDGRGGHLLASR